MKLRFLGTSAGIATRTRFNTAMLLRSETGLLLIDCGEPVSASLLRLGIRPDELTALVLTHLHPDHTGGFVQLIQTLQLTHRKAPLKVFLPGEGIDAFKKLLRVCYLYESILPFALEMIPIEKETVFEAGPFRIQFFANEHLSYYRPIAEKEGYPAPCESFCVRVSADGKSVVFSGDIRMPAELIAPLEKGADLLVSELVHFPPCKFAAVPGRLLPERICFTHYKTTPEDAPLEKDDPALKELRRKLVFTGDGTETEV